MFTTYRKVDGVKLIIGLGNPGKKYENTRHNVGFLTIMNITNRLNLSLTQEMFNGLYVKSKINGVDVIFAQPQTFMNLSGDFVQKIVNFFKIDSNDILVIYDDFDTKIGQIKVKLKGSSGGQNGMKDIISKLGTENIKRIKIGIGRPNDNQKDFVLSPFGNEDKKNINEAIEKASAAAYDFLFDDFEKIMSKYN